MAAALGGLDVLVFTGGIGENAAEIRRQVCQNAVWLDVRLNDDANEKGQRRINSADSGVHVWVLPTNEELMIAKHTQRVLGPSGERP
jgi:acetate kinase